MLNLLLISVKLDSKHTEGVEDEVEDEGEHDDEEVDEDIDLEEILKLYLKSKTKMMKSKRMSRKSLS